MKIHLITDSAADFTLEEAAALDVTMLPLKCCFGDAEYLDGVNLTHDAFFEKLVESSALPSTSQITPYEYDKIFSRIHRQGDLALCITLSSRLSGCWQSAMTAASDYPGTVRVVDSLNACIGQRILVELAARLIRSADLSTNPEAELERIALRLEQRRNDIRLIALLDTLEYLKKGGRISAATALAGTLLSIKPVVTVNRGEVVLLGQARGSRNGANKLNELIDHSGTPLTSMPYALAYSGLSDTLLRKYITDTAAQGRLRFDPTNLPIYTIGCAIGTHVGPGAIAVAYFVGDENP